MRYRAENQFNFYKKPHISNTLLEMQNLFYGGVRKIHWVSLTTSSATTSTQVQQADFLSRINTSHWHQCSKKFRYNEYQL